MKWYLIILLVLLALFYAWGLFAGGAPLTFSEVAGALFTPDSALPVHVSIVWNLRLPRMLAAFFVGASLALAGVISQALFRNPLADPFIVGTSAGAGFGVALALIMNMTYLAPGILALPLFAFAGSALVTFSVLILGRKGGVLPVNTLLLAGIAANYFFASLSTLLGIMGRNVLHRTIMWSLEGFAGANWDSVFMILPYLIIGALALLFLAKPLNLILLGEESALSLGLPVTAVKYLLVTLVALLTGAAVAISGVVGFVGLVVPHLARLMVGAHHRRLLPIAFLSGGVLLLGADNTARSILPGIEIPVALITALLGVPFFIYLLKKK